MTTAAKTYSQIVLDTQLKTTTTTTTAPTRGSNDNVTSAADLDADVLVIGAGIAGASIAHQLTSQDPKCRVIVVEQFAYGVEVGHDDDIDDNKTKKKSLFVHHGSSRGGPRRIGIIGGDERTCRAWQRWLALNDACPDQDLLDVCGEVYVFSVFPVGILFLILIGILTAYNAYLKNHNNDKTNQTKILWTPHAIAKKLGPAQGFGDHKCWRGCVGIYYKEAAALHTDRILAHFLHDGHHERSNLQVQYGYQVTNIKLEPSNEDDHNIKEKVVRVTVTPVNGDESYQLSCRHLVLAAGGWTGRLLKDFLVAQTNRDASSSQQQPLYDPAKILDKVEVFTCPVYTVQPLDEVTGKTGGSSNGHSKNDDSPVPPSPPYTLAAGCPIFSCVHKKVYGFPINHDRQAQQMVPLQLYVRPFYKAFDSDDPDDQRKSQQQQNSIDSFCQDNLDPNGANASLSFDHSYTCRYPKLSLDGGKSYRPVFDFVPGSNRQIVVVAGLDGYSFKFGSLYGVDFMKLLETGRGPKGLEWPVENGKTTENVVLQVLHLAFFKLAEYVFTSKDDGIDHHYKKQKKDD